MTENQLDSRTEKNLSPQLTKQALTITILKLSVAQIRCDKCKIINNHTLVLCFISFLVDCLSDANL